MRTIICKKCGAEIDAALGECPNCGAVYYILPTDEEKKLEWAMSTEHDADGTQVFENNETNQNHGSAAHGTRDILNADNDELFNTRVWKISDEQDGTKPVRAQGTEKPAAHVNRPVQQRPVRQVDKTDVPRTAAGNVQPPQNNKGILKNPLFVSGVALLAVLTLVLSVMGGLFNFGGSDSKTGEMPRVVGFTQESATTILNAMGLVVNSETEENEAASGTVIEQSIKEGKKVKEGDKVTIVVSSGSSTKPSEVAEYIDVPTLTGKTFDEARRLLTDMGLGIAKTDEDVFSDEDVGKIISQSPMKGAKLKTGDIVTVTVSKGPETTEYVITVTAGKGGTISPKGIVSVSDGEDQAFTITADDGYEVREVKVDGKDIGPVASYSFEKVTEDHTLYVVFAKKGAVSPSPSPSPSPTSSPFPSPTKPVSGTDIIA